MEESAMNLRRSLSVLNNSFYGGTAAEFRSGTYRSRFDTSQYYVSYPPLQPPPPLLPLPFSSASAASAATLRPVMIKKKAAATKRRKMKSRRKVEAKEVARAVDAEEEEEIVLSPPPSSLPLPRLLLTRRPKANCCFAEADSGTATDDLRRLLRL